MRVIVTSMGVLVLAFAVSPMGCATIGAARQTDAGSPRTVPNAVILVKGMT